MRVASMLSIGLLCYALRCARGAGECRSDGLWTWACCWASDYPDRR
jgi:hypothetical protein